MLVSREHLEGLEDKLREYKTAFADPRLYDEKVSSHASSDRFASNQASAIMSTGLPIAQTSMVIQSPVRSFSSSQH